jgi:dTDP-4-amino-4,6-dideoxygalactose transaminase
MSAASKPLAKTVGAKHAVVCANGTAALHMAARALDLGPGTKIVVPAITFLATASAPHMNGADIVFADVDPETG